jgi:16S rRNA (adenine1518-N6/adenine1519-N6)-dimethyltransferase
VNSRPGAPLGSRRRFARHPVQHSTPGQSNLEQPVTPRKRFGQHFLLDSNILRKLIRAAEIQSGDVVLEIGPGLGHLTSALLESGANVAAVEIDHGLAEMLKHEFQAAPALSILEGDFLSKSPEQWLAIANHAGANYKVVANLPYYITSAVLRKLLEASHQPSLLALMVQQEVAEVLTARPGAMSLLAVSVQFYGIPRIISHVPAGAFFPRPKVSSAIVSVLIEHPSRFPDVDPVRFFGLVRAGFAARRKQLHNALTGGLGMSTDEVDSRLLRAGIDRKRRAETLSLEEWRLIYRNFS